MQIIKDNKIVEDDWVRITELENDSPLPEGKVIIPFKYWLANREQLINLDKKFAVCADADDEAEEIAKDLAHFELIALDFPKFADGRSYSNARLLRDRYGYQGELRAMGDVLQDQLFYMHRCGFNAFQLREDKDINAAMKAFNDFTVKYQTAADGAQPVYRLRKSA